MWFVHPVTRSQSLSVGAHKTHDILTQNRTLHTHHSVHNQFSYPGRTWINSQLNIWISAQPILQYWTPWSMVWDSNQPSLYKMTNRLAVNTLDQRQAPLNPNLLGLFQVLVYEFILCGRHEFTRGVLHENPIRSSTSDDTIMLLTRTVLLPSQDT